MAPPQGATAAASAAPPDAFCELPITLWPGDIETPGAGQVRALIGVTGNPLPSAPNGARLVRAMGGLDFMRSLDVCLIETTRHADVILPGTSAVQEGPWDAAALQFSVRKDARYGPPVLPSAPGALPEWQILLKLAGAQADAVPAAVSRGQVPVRLPDLSPRAGPHEDRFGLEPTACIARRSRHGRAASTSGRCSRA